MTSASRIKDKYVDRGSYLLTYSDDASKILIISWVSIASEMLLGALRLEDKAQW